MGRSKGREMSPEEMPTWFALILLLILLLLPAIGVATLVWAFKQEDSERTNRKEK